MKMGISVALLAYKEEENLRVLLPQIRNELMNLPEEWEIIVIDTSQPMDATEVVCQEFGAKYFNQTEPYFGGAFRTAIQNAQHDKFLILDSDGSHPTCYIPQIYKKFLEGYDVVIGSRYVQGGITHDSKASIIMSKLLNTTFRLFLGIAAHDISTDYRIYYTKQLKEVKLSCDNYDILQEVLLKLKIKNSDLRIGEVPIEFKKRMFGDSKRNLVKFIISYMKTLMRLTLVRFFHKSN